MNVKCGNRKVHPDGAYHGSANEVRLCYAGLFAGVGTTVSPPPVAPATQPQASAVALLERPSAPAPVSKEIPVGGKGKGYFALPASDGVLHFFVVDRPAEGRWAGYTFLKEQASDEFYPVKGARKESILADIAQDPEAAGKAYADEIGRCFSCNRTLTDALSRSRGHGPDCAARS
jgi:hypothetical protein